MNSQLQVEKDILLMRLSYILIPDLMCECVKLHDYLRLNSSSCLVATYMHYTPVYYVVAVGNYGLCMRWWVSCMQQLRTCCALRTGYSAPALL